MNKGSRVITLRLTPAREFYVMQAIESANATRKGEPYTLSSWITACIDERLAKHVRAKKSARNRRMRKETGSDEPRQTYTVPVD